MAKSHRGKGTKAATVKRKPAVKPVRRTMIAETMTPQPEALDSLVDIGPITLEGTFDDGAISALERVWQDANGAPRELTIVNGRRFLWWTVAHQRIRQRVVLQPQTITPMADGVNVSVPMTCDGPCETILSPWWERTLYAIARIWS